MGAPATFSREVKKKVNLLGDPAVGKTSLILRYVKNVYGEEYLKTLGTNVYTKEVPLTGARVKLVIYDIMGEKDFTAVQQSAFRGSAGAIAVADVTRRETVNNLVDEWLERYRPLSTEEPPIILAINKDDLDKREITEEYITDELSPYFDNFFFTSAKTGHQVEELFRSLASRVLYRSGSHVASVEEILQNRAIDESKKLLSVLFAFTSEKGDMEHSQREKILEDAGIDKYILEEPVTDEQVLAFAEEVRDWYENEDHPEITSSVERIIEKYKEDS